MITISSAVLSGTLTQRAQCLLGFAVFIALAYCVGLRGGRARFPWRTLAWGVALQFAFALIVLWLPGFLSTINDAVNALLEFTRVGAHMVFGKLADNAVPVVSGDPAPRPIGIAQTGSLFAFFILPTIIFFSALTAVLYHLGIMQYVVQAMAWVMSRSMKTSGAETLSAAANIFVGQTEAPLMVKPFLAAATRSELLCIMVAGFANIATGVLGAYTDMLKDFVRDVGGHLAAACFISAPAALLVSKLILPERETARTAGGIPFKIQRLDANLLDAVSRGTSEGLALALNVGAMLISFTALIAMVNAILGWAGAKVGVTGAPFTIEGLLGYPMSPVAWLTGIPADEMRTVGSLIGVKTVLNEFVAYSNLSAMLSANPQALSPRSTLLTTYMLCGFANLASIGIQIGGISSMAPERRHDLSRLALLALLGGAISSHMTACVMGILI